MPINNFGSGFLLFDKKNNNLHDKSSKMQNNCNLFDFSPVPMWVYDIRDIRILAANKAACKDYGYTVEEFLSMTVDFFWPEEDKADI